MSHSIHLNQMSVMSVMLAKHHDEEENVNQSRALRFLETIDYEEEALRLRRRRRAQRAAGGTAGFTAARSAITR